MKTVFSKSLRGGYMAESMTETDANGKAWQITTMKRSNGMVSCSAIQGSDNGNGIFSYDVFGAKRLQLASEKTNGTEAAIRRVHAAGLIEFAKVQEANPETTKPAYVVTVGQIIFTDSCGNWDEAKRVIYEVVSPGHFKTVTLDGQQLRHDDHVKPYSEKFGIGTYYNEDETLPLEKVNDLVNQARQATEERNQKEAEARTAAAQEKARKIEAGRAIVPAIPEGVKAVIVAELHKNESDPMTDYYSHTTEQVVYLAWSTHTRDLFPEMRKAAEKFEGTKHLGTGKGVFTPWVKNTGPDVCGSNNRMIYRDCGVEYKDERPSFQTIVEAEAYTQATELPKIKDANGNLIPVVWEIESKEIEHREKYSMGSGYYLKDGHSNSTGWAVSKSNLGGYGATLEALQIAAAEGRFFCNTQSNAATEATNFEKVEVKPGTVQIIDYSEKAIAVIGDTRPIKDKLKDLGGKFNPRLSCGAGWIFSKTRLNALQAALSAPVAPDPETIELEPTREEEEAIKAIAVPQVPAVWSPHGNLDFKPQMAINY